MTILFYPTMTEPFAIAGVLERHAPTLLARVLRERTPVTCLLDHDPAQLVGTTVDGSLRLVLERDGLRAELTPPDTSPGRRLAAALAAGTVTGCSFTFTPRRVRWHLGPPLVRELLDADVSEVSLVLAPKRPANPSTWSAALGPRLRARYESLKTRPGAAFRVPQVAPAAVVLRLEPFELTPMVKLLMGDTPVIARERKAVEAAAREHPGARTIDIVYPRPLRDLLAASARHAARVFTPSGDHPVGTAAGTKLLAFPGRPANGPAVNPRLRAPCFSPSSPKKGAVMHDDRLPLLHPVHHTRREIAGAAGCDGMETLRRLKKYIAEVERDLPGATRYVETWKPFVDARGVWHAGPQVGATPAPLSVRECLEKTLAKLEAQ